ncbi:MAG: acyl-CoA thioesterase [Paracoccaceae bacterium]|nr:acyl-CoA thioesterase [Paracoccaceae bacterium]
MDNRTAHRPAPGTRADYQDFVPLHTRWSDNDVYGHLNNVVHYALFDTAVNGWLIAQSALSLEGTGPIGLVAESGCRYHGEIIFPDVVAAGLRVAHLGRSSVRYEIGLFRNDDRQAAAEGFFVHVYVDRQTRRPVPMSDAFRATLARLMV